MLRRHESKRNGGKGVSERQYGAWIGRANQMRSCAPRLCLAYVYYVFRPDRTPIFI